MSGLVNGVSGSYMNDLANDGRSSSLDEDYDDYDEEEVQNNCITSISSSSMSSTGDGRNESLPRQLACVFMTSGDGSAREPKNNTQFTSAMVI